MKRFAALFLILVMLLSIPVLAEQKPEDVLYIGVLEPLSGQHSTGGQTELYGIQFANSQRPTVTIDGKEMKVELLVEDNFSSKKDSARAVYRLIEGGAAVVLGSFSSALSLTAMPAFDVQQVPAVAITATNPMITDSSEYYFRMCYLDTLQGSLLAKYALEQKYDTVAIVAELDDDFAQGVADIFKATYEECGGQIALWEDYELSLPEDLDLTGLSLKELANAKTVDFTDIIASLKEAAPKAVFIPSSAKAGAIFLKQAKEAGLEATILSADTWDDPLIVEQAGDAADGAVFTTFLNLSGEWGKDTPLFKENFQAYLTSQGVSDKLLAASAALGYDAYNVVLDAIEKAGTTQGTAVRDAMYQVEYDGVSGPVKFDENGNNPVDRVALMTFEQGAIQFIRQLP